MLKRKNEGSERKNNNTDNSRASEFETSLHLEDIRGNLVPGDKDRRGSEVFPTLRRVNSSRRYFTQNPWTTAGFALPWPLEVYVHWKKIKTLLKDLSGKRRNVACACASGIWGWSFMPVRPVSTPIVCIYVLSFKWLKCLIHC